MANDKDFVVKGPVIVGKDTKVTVGSIAAGAVDLSTGNYFTDSPSGDYTYTFTNPGAVQAFQIEATGGSAAVASTFNTTLYTGTGAAQTITTGIDLATDGGLVWVKSRNGTYGHALSDTEHTVGNNMSSANTNQMQGGPNAISAFNSNGFSIGNDGNLNASGSNLVSWTFKKQAKFFDIVTYTGNGVAGRTVAHGLGGPVGFLVVKRTSTSGSNWTCYHKSLGNAGVIELNGTGAAATGNTKWNSTNPTTTEFTVSSDSSLNTSGATYVAYVFAHDNASDGLIQCGTFSGQPTSVNLGWQPQWLLCKRTDSTSNWVLLDNKRVTGGSEDYLYANTTGVEQTSFDLVDFTSTGFDVLSGLAGTQIYMAIRSASAPAITWPTSIEWAGGIAPAAPANAETDVFTFTTDDTGTSYTGVKSIDNAS